MSMPYNDLEQNLSCGNILISYLLETIAPGILIYEATRQALRTLSTMAFRSDQ
jgi:hypothetical protein